MSKQSLKVGNNCLKDEFARVYKSLKDGLTADVRHPFIENWKQARSYMHLHFATRRALPNLEVGEYCADLQFPLVKIGLKNFDVTNCSELRFQVIDARPSDSKGFVFVPVIEGRESSQEISFRNLPVVIRLVLLKECQHFRRHSGKPTLESISEFAGDAVSGESNLILNRVGGLCERESDVIERRTHVVNSVPDV